MIYGRDKAGAEQRKENLRYENREIIEPEFLKFLKWRGNAGKTFQSSVKT
jgi:hypothetical protein